MPFFIATGILNVTLASIIFEIFHVFSPLLIRIEFVFFVLIYGSFWLKNRNKANKHKEQDPHDKTIKTSIKNKTVVLCLVWALNICAVVVIIFQIWSVHFNYTGNVIREKDVVEVKNSQITTPMFSDEWLVASYIKKINETKSLPLNNPLEKDKSYPNTLFGFYSLAAGVSGIFGIDPVFQFGYLYIIFISLFSLAFYFFIKNIISKHKNSSIIAMFGVSMSFLIANSYSFVGLWALIPATSGITFLLFLIYSLHKRDRALEFISFIGGLIVYPPLVIFTVPLLFFYDKKISKRYIYIIGLSLVFVIGLVSSTGGYNLISVLKLIKKFAWRWVSGASQYFISPSAIIPFLILIIALYGIHVAIKKYKNKEQKSLVYFLAYVLMFWLLGAFFEKEFFIGYPRAVLVASLLLIVFACISIDYLHSKYKHHLSDILFRDLLVSIMLLGSTFMFVWGLEASRREIHTQKIIFEDLQNFENIKHARFISTPWKSLAIGVATDNYPLFTKESIVAVKILSYQRISRANCDVKLKIAKEKRLEYIYSDRVFDCPGIEKVGFETSEGFNLYRFDEIK